MRYIYSSLKALSFLTLARCRPPANSAFNHASKAVSATSNSIDLSPKQRTLASLCWRLNSADAASLTSAALTPEILFAAIEIPTPDPQTHTPYSLPH